MDSKRKRNELSLKDKIKLIRESDGKSQRQLAEKYGIGKTQVHSILKRKAEFLDGYEQNVGNDRKRLCTRTPSEELNNLMWEWFKSARAQGIPLSGPMLQEKALFFASELGISDFKASNGWLNRFRIRHNINFASVCGESGSVSQVTCDEWMEKLPSILSGYNLCDIYNMDETGLFFRALPDKSLSIKGEECRGGKRSKERITVALCVNAVGDFEKPLVIGKAAVPRCFRNLNIKTLPVIWRYNKKAWMTSHLFTEWIDNLNRKMRQANRQIILLLDNAPSHPSDLNLSNIKIVFLPANTTSKLQPLDQGIIQNMKQLYRKKLIRSVLSKIGDGQNVSSDALVKCVTVLDAVQWINSSINEIKKETVSACFKKAGVVIESDDVPLLELSENIPLSELRDMIRAAQGHLNITDVMSVDEFLTIDSDVPVHDELNENWESELLENCKKESKDTVCDVNEDNDDETTESELKINSHHEAVQWLSQIRQFCFNKNMDTLAYECGRLQENLEKEVVSFKCDAKQTTLDKFFH